MPSRKLYPEIYIGARIQRWSVVGAVFWDRVAYVNCRCDCGVTRTINVSNLLAGKTRSCGCLKIQESREKFATHGLKHTSIYQSWMAMRQRCKNPKTIGYKNYGGRGIVVCERWDSFELFMLDMGEKPAGTFIDRIDNDGNYEPGNCRWATRVEQARNRRSNRILNLDGKRMTVAEWGEQLGISPKKISLRLSDGFSVEQALFDGNLPRRKRQPIRSSSAKVSA